MNRGNRTAAFILLLGVLAISLFPLRSNDLWWHLATGRTILDQGIPQTDPFSFASDPVPWVNHAWGFDVTVYCLQMVLTPPGLIALRIAIVALIALFLWVHRRRRGEGPWIALAWILLLLVLARHRLMVRPELVALLLLVFLLGSFADPSSRKPRQFFRIALILLIWVNVHASFVLGLGIASVLLLGQSFRDRDWKPFLWILPFTAIILANPFGYRALVAPLRLMGDLARLPVENPEWARPSAMMALPLAAVTLFGLWILASRKDLSLSYRVPFSFVIVMSAVLALTAVRHSGILAVTLASLVPPIRWRAIGIFLGGALLAVFLGAWFTGPRPGWGVDREKFPIAALDIVEQVPPPGRLYNHPGMGGYLIWRLYPERQVFIDGRNELYIKLLTEINRSLVSLDRWVELLEKYGIRWAVLPYQGEVRVLQGETIRSLPASIARFPTDAWVLMDYDDAAMIFYARSEVPSTLQGRAYRVIPESPAYVLDRIREGTWSSEEVKEELNRKLKENPDCRRARELLDRIASEL